MTRHRKKTAFIDPTARIIGDVKIGAKASVWSHALLRADEEAIKIGQEVAILENTILEAPKGFPVIIETRTLISHGTILHGCKIGNGVLVGVGAIVLDGAQISDNCIVAAGAVVTPGTKIEPGKLVLGTPAKSVRSVRKEEIERIKKEINVLEKKAAQYKSLLG